MRIDEGGARQKYVLGKYGQARELEDKANNEKGPLKRVKAGIDRKKHLKLVNKVIDIAE